MKRYGAATELTKATGGLPDQLAWNIITPFYDASSHRPGFLEPGKGSAIFRPQVCKQFRSWII
jgi:hypothetical protein